MKPRAGEFVCTHPPGPSGAALAQTLAHQNWSTLKSTSTTWVARSGSDAAQTTLKVRMLDGLVAWLRAWTRRSPLHRESRGAAQLRSQGILAPEPVAHGSCLLDGRRAEFASFSFVPGHTVLDALARHATGEVHGSEARSTCSAIARTVVQTVRAGLLNRDFKPSNLIVTPMPMTGPRETRITQIDCAGIRRCDARRLDFAPIEMLTCLMLEPTGCGVAPSARLQARVVRDLIRAWNDDGSNEPLDRDVHRAGVRVVMRLVRERIARHGDPTPRDWPLSSPPGGAS